MPPKKTETKTEGAAAPKAKAAPVHPSYQDMITDAIIQLKDRNGSSRQSLKKYVKSNNTINASDNMFDSLFNKALKSGVDKGIFEQPKGPSGGTKLAKKTAAPKEKKVAAPKKAAAPKEKKE
ncbi:putative histone H1, partial [Triangularia setosa]